ncbi:hypothetical protein SNL152K_3548 [Streptomyces sp. NL15-2K]|nr:hypothetical protein SNL152K_3548 [Streptomyces sp. NL15-2K]
MIRPSGRTQWPCSLDGQRLIRHGKVETPSTGLARAEPRG